MDKNEFLSWELTSRDLIDVKVSYIDLAGGDLTAGVLLSQIIYWFLPDKKGFTKIRVIKDEKEWVAKSRVDWWRECRVSERAYDRAIRILEERGLLEMKVFGFAGKKTPHIRILWDKFLPALSAITEKNAEIAADSQFHRSVILRDGEIQYHRSVISNTETTRTENTLNTNPSDLSGESAAEPVSDVNAPEEKFLTVQDKVKTLINQFGVAPKPIPFLRFAYLQIFPIAESQAPEYGRVGSLFKKAQDVSPTEREAGELVIRLWVMASLAPPGVDPMQYAADSINRRKKDARPGTKFTPPDKEHVAQWFEGNGSNAAEGIKFFNFYSGKGWPGFSDWRPIAENWINNNNQDDYSGRVLFTEHREAVSYWERNRAYSKINFNQFFKAVDANGNDWNAAAHGENEKPLWKLIAPPLAIKRKA